MSDKNACSYVKINSCKSGALLIWDAKGSPPVGDWTRVLWRQYAGVEDPSVISIAQLVEQEAGELRARFLAWIHDLGEYRVDGRRVIDHLSLRPGFSYWWMTLFAEKCNYSKSMQIDNAIRLMAFDEWATSQSIGGVILVTANQPLAECMRVWCASLGVTFDWKRIASPSVHPTWLKRVYLTAPHAMQALLWLPRYLIDRWPLRGVGLQEWRETKGQVSFVSYLFNLNAVAVKEGRFESQYWAHFPDDLQKEGCKTNWLHLYVKDALLPNSKRAADVIRQFNNTGRGDQSHVTLDTFLGARVIIRTIFDWGRLVWSAMRLHKAITSSRVITLDLWPLFEEDWRRSMYGLEAMNNALFLNLFESAMKSLPKQHVGVYLQENQGWEFAFIHAWKAAGHGRLSGAPHSTIRYWDLRYFFDQRSYLRSGANDLPLPDQVALNGVAAIDVYQQGGYPAEDLVEVEALRYLHLLDVGVKDASNLPLSKRSLRVLVLGDYLMKNTHQQLDLLEKAKNFLPKDMVILVKPHPACPIRPEDYPDLKMEVTMAPLAKLFSDCDVAYSSNLTSAAVDAYCAGVPIVSMLDSKSLNFSPLRGKDGVLFASTHEELAGALISAASSTCLTNRRQDFFTLDAKLPRWRKLVSKKIG